VTGKKGDIFFKKFIPIVKAWLFSQFVIYKKKEEKISQKYQIYLWAQFSREREL
jgi:hypothetical protein